MLYREIKADCNDSHIKNINAICEQKVQFFNVKPGDIYSNYWALQG
jgi:hypothetical protein